MTINVDSNEFGINDKNNLWKGRNLYNLFKEVHTPWEWHETIFRRMLNNIS